MSLTVPPFYNSSICTWATSNRHCRLVSEFSLCPHLFCPVGAIVQYLLPEVQFSQTRRSLNFSLWMICISNHTSQLNNSPGTLFILPPWDWEMLSFFVLWQQENRNRKQQDLDKLPLVHLSPGQGLVIGSMFLKAATFVHRLAGGM